MTAAALAGTLDGTEISREDRQMGRHEKPATPQQETRGGNRVDWDGVVAGEPLPERPEAEYPEPDSTPPPPPAPLPAPQEEGE